MTKESRKTTDRDSASTQSLPTRDPGSLLGAGDSNLSAVMKANEALWSGMAAIAQEMMQFASTRLKDNISLSGSVMQCGDPREAFRLECDHARSATQCYLDQASKLMGLAADVSQRTWAPIEELAKETLGRVNQK